ncbi:MAG TPA: CoA pyrophosphatase [Thermohalobaculum sp.]|nr:CoA pyrophosphatase [Thermohalobaculum sp.]
MSGAPWPHGEETREALRANLARYRRQARGAEGLRPAAVAIVLAPSPKGDTGFLLTRRVARLSSHAGQYALPGGRIDPGEDALSAARRELAEELDIAAGPEMVLGALDDLPTRSGYLVTPFVVWLGGQARPRPSPAEIAALFHVPLGDLFAGPGRGGNRDEARGSEVEPGVSSLFIPTLGHDLFAPTAAILDHFREVALLGRPSPVVAFGEPRFARR